MTPLMIEILIHCHTSPSVNPRFEAPAVQEAYQYFLDKGVIEPTGKADIFKTSQRGRLHMEQLCSLPMPEKKTIWVDRFGMELEEYNEQ